VHLYGVLERSALHMNWRSFTPLVNSPVDVLDCHDCTRFETGALSVQHCNYLYGKYVIVWLTVSDRRL